MNSPEKIKSTVKEKYNAIAIDKTPCCGDAFCLSIKEPYAQIEGHVEEADLDLGCGLPTEHAGINPGDTVVDLGSGAGNDVFIARQIVGEHGRVIGIDMAENMHEKAMANLGKLGFRNVEFRLGEIEDIPLRDNVADVVVSNCVLNLVPNKRKAFSETYRILKDGGHFSISDVVTRGEFPNELREQAELYVGCVSGAIDREEYLQVIREAGFDNIEVASERRIALTDEILEEYLSKEEKNQFLNSDVGIFSVTVKAVKGDKETICGDGCC